MIRSTVPSLASAISLFYYLYSIRLSAEALSENTDPLDLFQSSINPLSSISRATASLQATATTSSPQFLINRSNYPEPNPHVCLAFLSCCDRTDLLNHTIAGAIRHMEEDEPSTLRYEIAWVDNGNSKSSTDTIKESYPIDHALTLSNNMGLAYGMNLLIHNLCTAPYILFLEEDWLYLDGLVAEQTEERKRAVATSVVLLEHLEEQGGGSAFDGRNVVGTFLRNEVYEGFLEFPQADIWERLEGVDLRQSLLMSSSTSSDSCSNSTTTTDSKHNDHNQDTNDSTDIDYRIFCADNSMKESSNTWGSYTNGAGLYRRSELIKTGRQFGEPGDAFHDRYVESNFAYRFGLRNCHAALRLTKNESCTSISDTDCTGAFHHIGGGRGTRPQTETRSKCMDAAWNFFGTPLYEKYQKFAAQITGEPLQKCSRKELEELRDQQFRDTDAESYREMVKKENENVFRAEAEKRQNIRDEAGLLLSLMSDGQGDVIRRELAWMQDFSDDDIVHRAYRMKKLADSPHPLEEFWDSHGRVKTTD